MPGEKVNTYDSSLVNKSLVVLRKLDLGAIDPDTYRIIGESTIGYGNTYKRDQENQLLWFRDGYILNDQVREAEASEEIIHVTDHFAVGRPDTQEILMDNLTLKEAEKAVSGAKLTLGVSVEGLPKPSKKSVPEVIFDAGDTATA